MANKKAELFVVSDNCNVNVSSETLEIFELNYCDIFCAVDTDC